MSIQAIRKPDRQQGKTRPMLTTVGGCRLLPEVLSFALFLVQTALASGPGFKPTFVLATRQFSQVEGIQPKLANPVVGHLGYVPLCSTAGDENISWPSFFWLTTLAVLHLAAQTCGEVRGSLLR